MVKRTSFLVLVLEGLVGLHRTSQIQLFGISGWSIDLDYCDIEWFALEMNRDHSVILEVHSDAAFFFTIIATPKEFLSTVVDLMVI